MTDPAGSPLSPDFLREIASASLPEPIALMRLMLAASGLAELDAAVAAACATGEIEPAAAERLRRLAAKVAHDPNWQTVRRTAGEIPHDDSPAPDPAGHVARLAARFDAAARHSPEASVALYSLGNPLRLEEITGEIVAWMRGRGLTGPDLRLLDIGCGIGRLEAAVHAEVGAITGCDISVEMIRVARQRCAGLRNVSFRRTSGLDLRDFADASFDAVIALDTFPYLVAAGDDLAARHVREAARLLAPGGRLLVLNYSYRGSDRLDEDDIRSASGACGLVLAEAASRPFRLWDGAVYLLEKPAAEAAGPVLRDRSPASLP